MFIQFEHQPPEKSETAKIALEKWSTIIKEKFPEIDIQVTNRTMRLHKKAGAPESLPPATQLFR